MNHQFLTFHIQNSLYAVDVSKVQEILEYTQPVKIPCSVSYVEGLISSRGEGISVIDLRSKFGMEKAEITGKTRIIILEIAKQQEEDQPSSQVIFGAIVDSVEEVIEIEDSAIEATPKFGNKISSEYIHGIGKKNDNFIILLDIDKVFSFDELSGIKTVK